MYCSKCGNDVGDEAFCSKCGNRTEGTGGDVSFSQAEPAYTAPAYTEPVQAEPAYTAPVQIIRAGGGSTMKNSGIVGMLAVMIGFIGFFLSWVDVYLLGIHIYFSGFDLIEGFNDATRILVLLICGSFASMVCFMKSHSGPKVGLALLGLLIVIISVYNIIDISSYYYSLGFVVGWGLIMEVAAGIIMICAAACPATDG